MNKGIEEGEGGEIGGRGGRWRRGGGGGEEKKKKRDWHGKLCSWSFFSWRQN